MTEIVTITTKVDNGKVTLILDDSYKAIHGYIHAESIPKLFLKLFTSYKIYLSGTQVKPIEKESIYFLERTAENMEMSIEKMMEEVEKLYIATIESDPELFI